MEDCSTRPRAGPASHPGVVPPFESRFPARTSALADPRAAFGRWLDLVGVTPDEHFELVVVFSELASNATATRVGSRPVVACASFDGAVVALSVENPDVDARWGTTNWDLEDVLRGGGRGLTIVQAFTDHLGVLWSSRGAVVLHCRRTVRH